MTITTSRTGSAFGSVRSRRAAAVIMAAGIALAPAATGVASAQTTSTAPQPAAVSAATIDFGATTSLTIKKSSDDPSGTAATGLADNYTMNKPLAGVTFKVSKVMDITNEADWNKSVGMTMSSPEVQTAMSAAGTSLTTGTDGTITFSNLSVGLYVVQETAAPDGYVKSKPFLVWLPMTNPTDLNAWNYNPTVFPKNTQVTVDKNVTDSTNGGVNVGDNITYDITTSVPNIGDGQTLKAYYINDRYLAAELKTPTVQSVQILDASDNVVTTLASGQYATSGPVASTGTNTDTRFSVAITDKTVLAQLQKNPTYQVKTTLNSTVLSAKDGVVQNDAWLSGRVGDGSGTWTPGNNPDEQTPGGDTPFDTPEDSVRTRYGDLKVNKFYGSTQLAGAEFTLYRCTDINNLDQQVSVGGTNSWTTDANGTLTITGLHVADFANNVQDGQGTQDLVKDLCLVETKAPSGYELRPEPIKVNFNWTNMVESSFTYDQAGNITGMTVTNNDLDGDGAPYQLTADVENVPTRTGFLPSTGGMGVGLLIVAGLGIIGAGAFAARRNSKQS